MSKFAAHVSLYDEGGQRHAFKPGDTVPDWANEKVGDHVLEGGDNSTFQPFKQPDVNPDGGNDLNTAALADIAGETGSDDEGDDDGEAEDDTPAETEGTPDFTKPAPRTRAAKK